MSASPELVPVEAAADEAAAESGAEAGADEAAADEGAALLLVTADEPQAERPATASARTRDSGYPEPAPVGSGAGVSGYPPGTPHHSARTVHEVSPHWVP